MRFIALVIFASMLAAAAPARAQSSDKQVRIVEISNRSQMRANRIMIGHYETPACVAMRAPAR